jgi:hypothetical protein
MLKTLLCAAMIVASGCASAPGPAAAVPACALPDSDRAWLERALEAWRFTVREITGIGSIPAFQAFVFSADCLLTSPDALTSPTAQGVTWTAAGHAGEITLPDGTRVPAAVTSFASGEEGARYFVMAAPTVWRAAGVGAGQDLERMLVTVLLHEASHVAQIGPYGPRLGALIDEHQLPDSFNDNAVQERFGSNPEFAESIARETELFLAAAAAPDDAEARRLAAQARELMRARQARWMVGEDAYLVEAEDLWLTFEGAGQWVAYQFQIHPRGGGLAVAETMPRFARGRQWSQTEGFAVVLALDRLAGPRWKRHAFGDGEQTVLEMLDAALAAP